MSKKIITPLDEGYRPGMMTWSLLQKFGVVASDDQQGEALKQVKDLTKQQHKQVQDKEEDKENEKDKDAPTKAEKETFRLALEVALSSSVISEDQVLCLWEASNALRAKDVARIASKALLANVSQVSEDAEGAAERFSQVLSMILAGNTVSSAQIRMLVTSTHELTGETIQAVLEDKLRDAYKKKEAQKQRKAAEEKMFRDKFREVLQFVSPSASQSHAPVLSEEAFQMLLAASVTLKPGVAEEIMESVGTSWSELRRRCTTSTSSPAVTVSVPDSSDSGSRFVTSPERDRAEAMLVSAAAATAEGRHGAAVDHYKAALDILIQLLRSETTVVRQTELSNYINYYMDMAERAKKMAQTAADAVSRKQEDVEEEDLEALFYDCKEEPNQPTLPVKPPKPLKPVKKTPPPPPPPPPPRRTASSEKKEKEKEASVAAAVRRPPQPPPPPPRRATITIDSPLASSIAVSSSSTEEQSGSGSSDTKSHVHPPPPPTSRRASMSSALLSDLQGSSSLSPPSTSSLPSPSSRPSMDLLASLRDSKITLKKVSSEEKIKKADEGSSLMSQLGGMIDKRRIYIQDDSSDSEENSDFDD